MLFFFLSEATLPFFFSSPIVYTELSSSWMADYRPQASVYCEWDPYASQSEGNFPQLFSHHVDNQALIAGDIVRHFPTVTWKKNNQWHEQLSASIRQRTCALNNRWFIVQADKRLSVSHQSPGCEQPDAGRLLPWFQGHAFFFFVCLCVRDRKRKKPSDYRHSSILTFISVNSARRGGQRREIVVKLINLQCANQPSWWYRLLCEWQNALVNDSRELRGPTRQWFLLSRVW